MGGLIAGGTFIIMLVYGADFISALIAAVVITALFSGGAWVNKKAETDTQSFAKWYGFTVMAGFVFLAIVFFNQ